VVVRQIEIAFGRSQTTCHLSALGRVFRNNANKDPKGEGVIMEQVYEVETADPFVRIWELNLSKSQAIAIGTKPDPQPLIQSGPQDNGINSENEFVEVW